MTDGGLDDDAVAGLDRMNLLAGGDDLADRLVSEHLRELRGHGTDAPVEVPMHVAAAESDGAELDEDFEGAGLAGQWSFADFDLADGDKLDGAHS